MDKEKTVQITFRTSFAEKEYIVKRAKEKGFSTNEYIKFKVLSDDSKETSKSDVSDDSTAQKELDQLRKDLIEKYISKTAFETLQKQLEQKDIQIDQLHKIIFNKDTKLLEYDNQKPWWQFWK
ncbi:TPA: hypothetical protein U3P06_001164 [Streptococcus agalactiae]|nr:hypothetical protein [Streptococcus agalactiae]